MVIQDVATSMDNIPHQECVGAPHGMHKLIGCTMGPGWRKLINQHVGGTDGCTHLREMLFNMATAAYQTLPSGQWQRRELAGQPHPEMTQAPYFLGQCHSWAHDSPTVQRAYPMFFRPKATSPQASNLDKVVDADVVLEQIDAKLASAHKVMAQRKP
jgi:hypothetical protein